jgi:biopolymer transport protein ExbD
MTVAELGPRLAAVRQERPDVAVMIRGETSVPHGRMAEIYEACRGAGVRHVAISVRARPESRRR